MALIALAISGLCGKLQAFKMCEVLQLHGQL
jgi:hypothetical protein